LIQDFTEFVRVGLKLGTGRMAGFKLSSESVCGSTEVLVIVYRMEVILINEVLKKRVDGLASLCGFNGLMGVEK
jgi:hypothetical protein